MFVTLRKEHQASIHLKPVENLLLVLINISDAFVKHFKFLLINIRYFFLLLPLFMLLNFAGRKSYSKYLSFGLLMEFYVHCLVFRPC
jgi:hypothetical protein